MPRIYNGQVIGMTTQEQVEWIKYITGPGYCDENGNPVRHFDTRSCLGNREWLLGKITFGNNSGNKIPRNYQASRSINEVFFYTNRSDSLPNNRKCAHRVFVVCPVCHKNIPIGRFRQHTKRADHQEKE